MSEELAAQTPSGENHHHSHEHRHHRKKYNLLGNMFISFIITYAAGTLCFESHQPEAFITIYRFAVMAVCLMTWLGLSFECGARKKWSYTVFTAIFWLLPFLVIYLADYGPRFMRMSITMYLLSEFFGILITAPAEYFGSAISIGAIPSAIIIVLLCVFAYLAGVMLSDKLTKKR